MSLFNFFQGLVLLGVILFVFGQSNALAETEVRRVISPNVIVEDEAPLSLEGEAIDTQSEVEVDEDGEVETEERTEKARIVVEDLGPQVPSRAEGELVKKKVKTKRDDDGEKSFKEKKKRAILKFDNEPGRPMKGKAEIIETKTKAKVDEDGRPSYKIKTDRKAVKIKSNKDLEKLVKEFSNGALRVIPVAPEAQVNAKVQAAVDAPPVAADASVEVGAALNATRELNTQLAEEDETPAYEPVPAAQQISISERLRVTELLIRRYGRAYDYRQYTTKQLKKILADLDRQKKIKTE